jgi:two-component SAPR family response regulator
LIKVILVDDERNALLALRDVLARFEQIEIVASFTNPFEALESAKTLEYQAVFTDIVMPGMHGLELAEKLRRLKPDVQIVLISVHHRYALEAFDMDAADYLLKPLRQERVAKTVEKLLEKNIFQ